MKDTVTKLLEEAEKVYEELQAKPIADLQYAKDEEIDSGLRDIENRPYLFVLACVMDRQITADKAWTIPYKVCQHFNINDFKGLVALTEEDLVTCFEQEKLHRYNEIMAKSFYAAVQRIQNVYNGDASLIWKGKPSSAEVVYRFLCFDGVGVKIATMATNLLARDYKVELKDKKAIDISPDVHVCRILCRLGLVESEERNAVIYKAKEISPDFPGLLDGVCWKFGREFCHPQNPECAKCPLKNVCATNMKKYKSK